MTGELRQFKEDLRRELVAAAYRQRVARRSTRRVVPFVVPNWRSLSPIAGVAAAGLLVTAAVAASSWIRADPAAADVFAIAVIDDRVELAVVDIIVDPAAVTRQLAEELGLRADLVAVPVPEALVGQIVVTGSSGGTVAPEAQPGRDGVIDEIVLPEGFNGTLFIEYGREAEPGETYKAVVTDGSCAELWGLMPVEAGPVIDDLAVNVYYETIDAGNGVTTRVAVTDLDPTYQLADIVYLDGETIVVTYVADIDQQPRHPNCHAASGG
jgi:hypothetical protein